MRSYEGIFHENKKNGIGFVNFHNGSKFLGEFKNDKANGLGIFYKANGEKVIGMWENDLLINTFT